MNTHSFLCRVIKAISHHIFRNLKAFLYGEEHRIYLCNISVFMKSILLVEVLKLDFRVLCQPTIEVTKNMA